MHPLPALLEELARRRLTLAVAESLTGGQLAAAVTAVPGASRVFRGGVVAYATETKTSVLGVPTDLVASHGVVSSECAAAMAVGVRRLLGTDLALATTGVAGPDLQEGHPAGTVFVAIAGPEGVSTQGLSLTGDRGSVQAGAWAGAVDLLSGWLRSEQPGLR